MTDWSDRPNAPAEGTRLGPQSEVPDNGAKEYVFGEGRERFRMVVVRRGEGAWGYLNICPHHRVPMNKADGGLLTADDLLWCGLHYSQFRFEDGFCVDGPCKGGALTPVPVVCREGVLMIGRTPA